MEKFTSLTAVAAPIPIPNIDTDMIIPKQFLKTIKRTGLGENLFDEMRYNPDGSEIADFVLNRKEYRKAKILVTYDNFGCGSSREHAPWALIDFGIRCIIAPSFADIFYNNSSKNGILAIRLPKHEVEILMEAAKVDLFSIDLASQSIILGDGQKFIFEIDPFRKKCLMEGLDDIGMTMKKASFIDQFEQKNKITQPWLYY